MPSVTKLFTGDPRCEQLFNAMQAVMFERGEGLPIPSILGVLELLKDTVKENTKQ